MQARPVVGPTPGRHDQAVQPRRHISVRRSKRENDTVDIVIRTDDVASKAPVGLAAQDDRMIGDLALLRRPLVASRTAIPCHFFVENEADVARAARFHRHVWSLRHPHRVARIGSGKPVLQVPERSRPRCSIASRSRIDINLPDVGNTWPSESEQRQYAKKQNRPPLDDLQSAAWCMGAFTHAVL